MSVVCLEYLLVVALSFFFHLSAYAQPQVEALNWCEQANTSLRNKEGGTINCQDVNKRCVRMNNYWCQKHGSSPWQGTPDASGRDGNRDVDGHAIFSSVDWSARAIAVDIRAKYRRGLTSAVQIAAQYSPWCDTLGSKAVLSGSGRSCKDGRALPPASFAGPLCEAPKTTKPSSKDCRTGCNCPPAVAKMLVKGLNVDVNADLQLFDTEGRPLPNLNQFLKNLALQEQGIYVESSVIESGVNKLAK